MATIGLDVGENPINLGTSASPDLIDAQDYTLQNTGGGQILFAVSATAPTVSGSAWHVLPYGVMVGITIDVILPVWVVALSDQGRVTVTEAD